MEILINGDPRELTDGLSLADLVDLLELSGKRIAIEVNEELVPRSEHDAFTLSAGDRVEIVQAIGGG